MKPLLLAAIVAMAASGPAWAQSSTATGAGIARSTSGSQAISGQGGSATITSNSTVPADQTVKNVPSVFAPGLSAAGLETCLGSVSGGGAFVGTGFSFGTSIPDPSCAARLDARTLWSMGLKKAAVARLCLNGDIYRAMPDVCAIYLPRAPVRPVYAPTPVAYASAATRATDEQPYAGGPILLAEGETGKIRLCNDYDEPGQRCRVWAHVEHHSTPKKATAGGWKTGGFPTMERCTKTDDEPGLLQKTSMLCGKFFPPVVPTETRPDVRTVLTAYHADEAVLKIGQPRFGGITGLDQAANSLTRSIARCRRFLILIQCFDRPA
jgi:hypothetical protein